MHNTRTRAPLERKENVCDTRVGVVIVIVLIIVVLVGLFFLTCC